MKKALFICLIAIMVIALAAPVFAAKKAKTTAKVAGSINQYGYYLANRDLRGSDGRDPDAWMRTTAELAFSWTITPVLYAGITLEVLDAIWGYSENSSITTHKAYVYWITKYGTWIWGNWDITKTGITSVAGGIGNGMHVVDNYWFGYSESYADHWNVSYKVNEMISLGLYYTKIVEGDAYGTDTMGTATTDDDVRPVSNMYGESSDGDFDYYGPSITFTWSTGGASFGVAYLRGRGENGYSIMTYYRPTLNVVQHFGPFTVALGISSYFGDYTWTHDMGQYLGPDGDDMKFSVFNYDLVLEYKEGPIYAGIHWRHLDGDGDGGNATITNADSVGADFDGLLIMFNTGESALGNYNSGSGPGARGTWGLGAQYETPLADPPVALEDTVFGTLNGEVGINILIIYVEYKVMKGMWVQAAFGWAAFTQTPGTTTTVVDGVSTTEEWSKAAGYELDLGLMYQLARNLKAIVRFGMFTPGSYFDDAAGPDGDIGSTWTIVYKIKLSLD